MSGQGSRDATSSIWLAVERVGLPDKKYFKIGEVASLVGVEPHVLRYWQTQFPQVRPQKSRSGHRLYRKKDVETLLLVRELLHVQRFTIAGARQALRSLVRADRPITGLPAVVDDEAPPAPARPFAAPPRAAATEVAAIDVEGLEGDELEDALARQLVSARADGEVATVDVEPLLEGADAHEVVEVARQAHPPPAVGAAMPSSHAPSPHAPSPHAPSSRAASPHAPSSSSAALRERKEQLGFGFPPSNRGAIEAARLEVLAMLDLLDREDAAANRLRARPATAKS